MSPRPPLIGPSNGSLRHPPHGFGAGRELLTRSYRCGEVESDSAWRKTEQTLVNMDRNHDLRPTDRGPRRAKDFEPELGRGSGFEFEIIRFTH
jgi:hypothetical protein